MNVEIIDLIDDCRYLAAKRCYESQSYIESKVNEKIHVDESSSFTPEENRKKIDLMLERSKEIECAIARSGSDLAASVFGVPQTNENWILGSILFGISTHYKRIGENDIIVKMEGKIDDLPIFEQCAVIHEVDLFNTWIPFCDKSVLIEKIGKAELIAYMNFNIMGISRDLLLHAYGADCTLESDKIIIVGKSIESYGDVKIPWKSIGWFHNRIDVKEFKLVLNIVSPSAAEAHIIAHLDFNAPLPASIVNYLVTKVAGLFLYFFQRQSRSIIQHNEDELKGPSHKTNEHAERIRSNEGFYKHWVLPKIQALCRQKGWAAPSVPSLEGKEAAV